MLLCLLSKGKRDNDVPFFFCLQTRRLLSLFLWPLRIASGTLTPLSLFEKQMEASISLFFLFHWKVIGSPF